MKGFLVNRRICTVLALLCALACGACDRGGGGGIADAAQVQVVPVSANADLAALALSAGALDQAFQPTQFDYTSRQAFLVASIRVIPSAADPGATITVAGVPVPSGFASPPIPLSAGDERLVGIEVTASDGVTTRGYTIAITREPLTHFAQRAYLKASNSGANDWFGYSVALSGNTLAVGAYQEDGGGTGIVRGSPGEDEAGDAIENSGAVYVFVRDTAGNWSQQAYLKGTRARTGTLDNFGASLALSGDTLAVGAPFDNGAFGGVTPTARLRPIEPRTSLPDSGAVYVFTRDGEGVWSQQAYIKASNAGEGDAFGLQLALWENTLAVGAVNEDSALTGIFPGSPDETFTGEGAVESGAVYVFVRDADGNWTQQAYIKASNAGRDDDFGSSLALVGDTLAVGAPGEAGGGVGIYPGNPADIDVGNQAPFSGAVYVFARDGAGNWSQEFYIKPSNTGIGDGFGWSIALSDDSDTLAVGAWLEDGSLSGVVPGSPFTDVTGDGAFASGAVYVYTRRLGWWFPQAYIKASNTGGNDWFGWSVALGKDVLAVGAVSEDGAGSGVTNGSPDGNTTGDDASGAGAVYLYVRDEAGNWSQQAYVKASNTGSSDQFGYSIALSEDLLAVGAPFESGLARGVIPGAPAEGETGDGLTASGAVYVFQ